MGCGAGSGVEGLRQNLEVISGNRSPYPPSMFPALVLAPLVHLCVSPSAYSLLSFEFEGCVLGTPVLVIFQRCETTWFAGGFWATGPPHVLIIEIKKGEPIFSPLACFELGGEGSKGSNARHPMPRCKHVMTVSVSVKAWC